MPGPLGGLLVVDLSRHLPGPLATRLLADLGARVIKVEEPGLGDPVRRAPGAGESPGALAALLLAGVDSVALDLKLPGSRARLESLLANADVLVESFRPGTLARLGMAPADLRARFPRLVICSLSGFGQDGPLASHAGHDLTYQALAGALAPLPAPPAQPVADLVGAWSAACATLAALWARERHGPGGQGAWIDASLLDAGVAANVLGWAAQAARPRPVGEPLALSGGAPCYGVYRTRDGQHLALALLESRFWAAFCELVGEPRLLPLQWESGPEARRAVEAVVARHAREEWEGMLAGVDLPIAPVLSAAEAAAHPQTSSRGMLGRGADGHRRIGFPARFDGRRLRVDAAVPALGAHGPSGSIEAGGAPPPRAVAGRDSWRRLRRWIAR